ncbi:MAG: hypothetical protein YK1309IOTA_1940002 [Marine Group I thaumarchaeote]|nr:MAG: hypothetical protein YK1309IOTA_1940002 [Marine Group I thaumarchaeote]
MAICPSMVTYQKSMQIIALLSFLVFIPSLGYAESLSEMARQLDEENLEKIKHVSAIEKKSDFSKLDCPEGAYHGLDNQGNDACRDVLTNQIVDPETRIITDSGNEMIIDSGRGRITDSGIGRITDSGIGEIILNGDQTDYGIIGILGLIGIIAAVIGLSRKKIVSGIAQRRGWSMIQNQQVTQAKYQLQHLQYSYIRKIEHLHHLLEWKIQLRRKKITQSIQGLNKLVQSSLR